MPSFTTTFGIQITIENEDLSLYLVSFDFDIVGKFITITTRDDGQHVMAKLLQRVDVSSMITITVMDSGYSPIRRHEISNLDVSSIRFISEAEARINHWQLDVSFSECETTYLD